MCLSCAELSPLGVSRVGQSVPSPEEGLLQQSRAPWPGADRSCTLLPLAEHWAGALGMSFRRCFRYSLECFQITEIEMGAMCS